MLAVAMDDFVVAIVDTDLRRVVRRFKGHQNRVTDLVRDCVHLLTLIAFYLYDSHTFAFRQPLAILNNI